MAANATGRIGEAFALILASSSKKQFVRIVARVYFTPTAGYFTIIFSCGTRGYFHFTDGLNNAGTDPNSVGF